MQLTQLLKQHRNYHADGYTLRDCGWLIGLAVFLLSLLFVATPEESSDAICVNGWCHCGTQG